VAKQPPRRSLGWRFKCVRSFLQFELDVRFSR
jgi:hypothetical protein